MDCDALSSASATFIFIQKLRCGLCNEKSCNYSYFISDDFLFMVIVSCALMHDGQLRCDEMKKYV